jgi:hypothetical protein
VEKVKEKKGNMDQCQANVYEDMIKAESLIRQKLRGQPFRMRLQLQV